MSELQDRLEHLVNYSSQLIFVSGDSIAQQQRALEEFLSVQKENTEISYFTSDLTMESPDFRRTICRQLLGQKVGSFVRPLKELLKDLHEQPGPFLLCIKQAQTLPNSFLQELWDWVTESKKQSPDHHVNVILFGETAWAEKAKKWLPKRNSSRPVLLSSQSVDSSIFDVNALESLMSEERPTFSLSMFRHDEYSPPIVTQKWFIVTILVLLFCVFIGLMSWQYPSHVKSVLQTGHFPPESELTADQLAIFNQQLDAQSVQQQNADAPGLAASQADKATMQQSMEQSTLEVNESDSPLVASWDEAKQASNNNIDAIKQSIENTKQISLDDAAAINNAAALNNATVDIVDAEQEALLSEGDFAVPDIISIEQLDATLGSGLISNNADQIDNETSSRIDSDTESTIIEPSEQEVLLEESDAEAIAPPSENELSQSIRSTADSIVYEFNESSILALSEPGVLLQISGIQNKSVLNEYITDNELQDIVWIYQTTRYGGPWHVVLINQRFSSLSEAREAAALLPQSAQANAAFAKDLAQIKLEIRNR